MLGLGAGAAAAVSPAGCGGHEGAVGAGRPGGSGPGGDDRTGTPTPGPKPDPKPTRTVRPIGDGSTSFTGVQPHQPEEPVPLEPGRTPPQSVVFSWDGAGEVGNGLFPRFLDLAKEHGASMTFLLSGLYLLPESKKRLYDPPNNPRGASGIGYLTDGHIKDTPRNLRRAWLEGHETGTHFNGHFCGGSGSVGTWTPQQWRSEIEQATSFVKEWRTNSGWTDLEPLPFGYDRELVGGRTPCLLGRDNLLPTARGLGWRHDASSPGGRQVWPSKKRGVWDFPLQRIPFPGRSFEVLSMDCNILADQPVNSTDAPAHNHPGRRRQVTRAYISGFERAYGSNRAPFFLGDHFEQWNGGICMDAVEEALKHIAREKEKGGDVRLVSFRQSTDWLDVQKPEVLERLRTLDVGQEPAGDWKAFGKDIGSTTGTGAGDTA
ncbi:hypothetical protein KYY02_15420 [Streptomyces pimonensis]|uniref:Secreted protein n=1 Tax=Streptomyces pimonensis TaxID=2860288 RepID=A0ABV4J2J5_9ACTN